MSGLTIDEDILRRKRDPYENMDMSGVNPMQQGAQGVGGAQNGGALSEFGIPISIVEEAKNTNIFYAAAKAEGTTGGGAAATFAPTNNTLDSGIQADSAFGNQQVGEVTVQPPNTSGTQVLSSALTGAEKQDGSGPQGGATDEQKHQNYQFSQEGNLASIAYSGNGEETSTLSGSALDGLNARLGTPTNTGEATLTATDGAEDTSGAEGADGADGADAAGGAEGADGANGAEGTDGNVNGSGNEEDANDSANGDVDDGDQQVETAEDQAKRLAEEENEKKLQEEQQRKVEEQRLEQQSK